ncbi:MAG TPA: hypothetical protein VFV65_07885 [Gemmatimonadales bacterium]|nr:hypothetical protein [Gemmatimonadales bacterium]
MIHALPLATVLATGWSTPAGAQVRIAALMGVTGSSALVTDEIFETIKVTPALAPTFFLSASIPVATKLRASLDLSYGSSTLNVTEGGQDGGDIGSLGAFTASAALAGPLVSRFDWRLSVGLLKYSASEETGIFAGGVPTAALFGAGLDWRQPLSERWTGIIGARYDLHLFSTPALEAAGFGGSTQVSRVGLAVGAAWELP